MEEQGIALEEAKNGKEAVELVKEGRVFDLILMDREMPVMDGPQVIKLHAVANPYDDIN